MSVKDFTKKYYVKRTNTNCVKWDASKAQGLIPMWIADMDFKTDEHIISGLTRRIEHGAFGYSLSPKDYFDAFIAWHQRRHDVTYDRDWIRFTSGAVDGIVQCLYAFTEEKDAVLITTPVYPPFSGSIKRTGRTLVTSPLLVEDNYCSFDYRDIERKFKKKNVKAMILCSPHNPLGRVWKKGELEELFDLCQKYNVLVISDEVHGDLIMPDQEFVPALSLKKYHDSVVSLSAVSKTFNLAIFYHSQVIIPNRKLRKIFDEMQYKYHKEDPNEFSLLASYYGYKHGDEWLDGLLEVVYDNYKYLYKRLSPYCDILPLEGSYLCFVNFKDSVEEAADFLKEDCGILANPGESFGKGYETWARFNLATSHAVIKKACDAIIKALDK